VRRRRGGWRGRLTYPGAEGVAAEGKAGHVSLREGGEGTRGGLLRLVRSTLWTVLVRFGSAVE